jgi:glycosyltransferase involved in cell wall biosynthesis
MVIDFCVPIHNEEQILENNTLKLLNYLKSQNFNFAWCIILIINGSTDDSIIIGEKLAKNNPAIKIKEIKKPSKSLSLKEYFLESSADIIIYMDADLAVSLEDIPSLIFPIIDNDYDLVIGSRLLKESKTERSLFRELSSQIYNVLSRLILKHNLSDLQCGFKAMKKEVFMKISNHINDPKWFFDTELIAFSQFFHYKIKEIPVNWSENRYEKRNSKVKVFRDSLTFIKNLFKLRGKLKRLSKPHNND